MARRRVLLTAFLTLSVLILGLGVARATGFIDRQFFTARFQTQIPPEARQLQVDYSDLPMAALGEYSTWASIDLPPGAAEAFVAGLGAPPMEHSARETWVNVLTGPASSLPAWMRAPDARAAELQAYHLYGQDFSARYRTEGSLIVLLNRHDPALTRVYLAIFTF